METLLQAAKTLLVSCTATFTEPEPDRLDVALPLAELETAVNALHSAHWGYLSAITGLDLGVESGQLEVLYQFCSGPAVVTLRVQTPRTAASVPTITKMIPFASLFERELSEMFGVTVVDTPDPSRLFLPDDWPEGIYPLRKDAPIDEAAIKETTNEA